MKKRMKERKREMKEEKINLFLVSTTEFQLGRLLPLHQKSVVAFFRFLMMKILFFFFSN